MPPGPRARASKPDVPAEGPEVLPAETKAARTRERLLDAAAQVLSRKGFAGTRLSEIAEVAGVQAPAIYYYYASREELIEEVIRRGQERTRSHVERALAALPAGAPAMGKIRTAVEAHLRSLVEMSDYSTAAVRNVGQMPDDMRKRLLAAQAEYGSVWRALFVEARERGEIAPDVDLHAAQLLLIGALNSAPEWWNPRRVSLDEVVATALLITDRGLSAPGGEGTSHR
ncbi:MAG: regulatory protein TetR [Blastococcus sp.]|jgi:AcrR family transcriptional regulator|nr:regulatory protein TetR [Blastococcus sp.]